MNNRTDHTIGEGGSNDPEQLLNQLLAHHRTHLTNAVADALDTSTGRTALSPLRREIFHGIKPLKLAAPPPGCTSNSQTADPTPPLAASRLQGVLTRLCDIRLTTEKVCAGTGTSTDIQTRAQTVLTRLQHLHAGLQARSLTHDQARMLFEQLRSRISTECDPLVSAGQAWSHLG
ncbi:hypothetical protein [Streptomyces ipomoeae]|uniref:Uncharacterized protein n=1 Tax=Streptomyces ipomoeae 91-03 TaxID=698759 RepID=L1L066_9ACTN|nr:hypothetical protein [Streptomyces ipomoeae]EKX66003.1 hypothetical protein STRIP9103_09643 [Streptomyces ipomoeae 91-03]